MKKLRLYKVKEDNIPYFTSYLSGRTQYVSRGVKSDILAVIWGVVQGSILGPIIFLLVINNIAIIGDINDVYADDTCIHLSLSGIKTMIWDKDRDQTKLMLSCCY